MKYLKTGRKYDGKKSGKRVLEIIRGSCVFGIGGKGEVCLHANFWQELLANL